MVIGHETGRRRLISVNRSRKLKDNPHQFRLTVGLGFFEHTLQMCLGGIDTYGELLRGPYQPAPLQEFCGENRFRLGQAVKSDQEVFG